MSHKITAANFQTKRYFQLPLIGDRNWRQWLANQGYATNSPNPFEELYDAEIYFNSELNVSALRIPNTNRHLKDGCLWFNIPSLDDLQQLLRAESKRQADITAKTTLLETADPFDLAAATYSSNARRQQSLWLLSYPNVEDLPNHPDPKIQSPIVGSHCVVDEERDLFDELCGYLIATEDHEPYLTAWWANKGWHLYGRGRATEIALGLWQVEDQKICYFCLDC